MVQLKSAASTGTRQNVGIEDLGCGFPPWHSRPMPVGIFWIRDRPAITGKPVHTEAPLLRVYNSMRDDFAHHGTWLHRGSGIGGHLSIHRRSILNVKK
jgi:hypothetical protein